MKIFKTLFLLLLSTFVLAFNGCSSASDSSYSYSSDSDSKAASEDETPAVEVGDYVLFGNYNGEPILWRIVRVEDNKPILWSADILTFKSFDASESGQASSGENNAEKYGSNTWSGSNVREWLNSSGPVEWSGQPPIEAAIWGLNAYYNEHGFLTDFNQEEKDLIASTSRGIYNSGDELIETTQDLVFLPGYNEVRNAGVWGFNSVSDRIKIPTEKALEQNKNDFVDIRLANFYYLCSPGTGANAWQIYGVLNSGEFFVGDPNDSYVGIAPALRLETLNPSSGSGTREDPWVF